MGERGETATVHPLRAEREARLWTQEQLARRARVSLRTISSIEHGRPCRMWIRRRLLEALGMPLERHGTMFPQRLV